VQSFDRPQYCLVRKYLRGMVTLNVLD